MSSSRGVSLVSALEGLKKDGEIEKIAKKGMKKRQKTRNSIFFSLHLYTFFVNWIYLSHFGHFLHILGFNAEQPRRDWISGLSALITKNSLLRQQAPSLLWLEVIIYIQFT